MNETSSRVNYVYCFYNNDRDYSLVFSGRRGVACSWDILEEQRATRNDKNDDTTHKTTANRRAVQKQATEATILYVFTEYTSE